MKVGTPIRHADGTLGTITAVLDGKPGERLIEWKSCGRYRVSSESVLAPAQPQTYRWRATHKTIA